MLERIRNGCQEIRGRRESYVRERRNGDQSMEHELSRNKKRRVIDWTVIGKDKKERNKRQKDQELRLN